MCFCEACPIISYGGTDRGILVHGRAHMVWGVSWILTHPYISALSCRCMYACVLVPLDIHVEWDHSTSHSTFSLDVRRLLWPHDRCKIFWNHNGSAALAYTSPRVMTNPDLLYTMGAHATHADLPTFCFESRSRGVVCRARKHLSLTRELKLTQNK